MKRMLRVLHNVLHFMKNPSLHNDLQPLSGAHFSFPSSVMNCRPKSNLHSFINIVEKWSVCFCVLNGALITQPNIPKQFQNQKMEGLENKIPEDLSANQKVY
ncbi:hypothetical protein AMECASPLE_010444 [Ameca splendens]|uniref:Uncharacterized protein n=1 Tax=Ameca splendens TaxID=208324 RepID=A0ABV1A6U3_9TELE